MTPEWFTVVVHHPSDELDRLDSRLLAFLWTKFAMICDRRGGGETGV